MPDKRLERAHQMPDAAEFFPGLNVPTGAASAVRCGAEGRWGDAALAAGTIIPGGEHVTTVGEGIAKGIRFLKNFRKSEAIADNAVRGEKYLPVGVRKGWPPSLADISVESYGNNQDVFLRRPRGPSEDPERSVAFR